MGLQGGMNDCWDDEDEYDDDEEETKEQIG